MYYVGFSTSTLVASLILFQGLNTTDASTTLSLLAGFVVTFLGVHLLNLSRAPEPPLPAQHSALEAGLMNPRLSVQGRLSLDGWGAPASAPNGHSAGANGHALGHVRRGGRAGSRGNVLFNAYEDELPPGSAGVGLERLREVEREEEDEDEEADERTQLRTPAQRAWEREREQERRSRTSPRGSPVPRSGGPFSAE